jgi:ferrochelatase
MRSSRKDTQVSGSITPGQLIERPEASSGPLRRGKSAGGRGRCVATSAVPSGQRRALRARAATTDAVFEAGSELRSGGAQQAAAVAQDRVGILLLNLGGPETLDDVKPFLYNLFADPDIIRLPPAAQFLQPLLASLISTIRAPKSAEGYQAIGGGSPLRRITDEQAQALAAALEAKGQPASVYVGMRYWHPYTEEALELIKRDGVTRLVILPLYPQFSISTSGSSLRLLESLFKSDTSLKSLRHTVIPSWYQRRGYVNAMADLIVEVRFVNLACPLSKRCAAQSKGQTHPSAEALPRIRLIRVES